MASRSVPRSQNSSTRRTCHQAGSRAILSVSISMAWGARCLNGGMRHSRQETACAAHTMTKHQNHEEWVLAGCADAASCTPDRGQGQGGDPLEGRSRHRELLRRNKTFDRTSTLGSLLLVLAPWAWGGRPLDLGEPAEEEPPSWEWGRVSLPSSLTCALHGGLRQLRGPEGQAGGRQGALMRTSLRLPD
jgi:hypothetical protein